MNTFLTGAVIKIRRKRIESDPPDTKLVEGCLRGDQQAWESLINRYERLIYSIALSLCREPETAVDILQQVCLELYQRLEDVRSIESLPGWISTVTRRKTFAHLRSLKPTEPLLDDDRFVEPTDRIDELERQHLLVQALNALPERCRRLIELLYLTAGGKSYEEVSAEMNMPVASIGPTRNRCLQKLKKLLD